MSKEIKHLQTKIRIFEDMLLRSKNQYEIEMLKTELSKMRIILFKMGGANIAPSF